MTAPSQREAGGAGVRLLHLVHTSERVASTRARNEKVALLAECVAAFEPHEVELGVAYLSGELPQGRIGIGYATLRAAAPGTSASRASLTLHEVDRRFAELSSLRERGAASRRRAALAALLALATEPEQRFLTKLLLGELRQGALAGVLVEAVAAAARVGADRLRVAAMLGGGLPAVAAVALAAGESGLARYRIELFRPLEPMLATPAVDLEQALARFGRAALEYKLDGARVQVHRLGDDVRIFSRSGKDVSAAVPEIVEGALRLPLRCAVLDGEAIALDRDGRPRPFQTTMRRFGRRKDVAALRASVPLSLFVFDCLHLDGSDTIDWSYLERVEALDPLVPRRLQVPRLIAEAIAQGAAFLDRALAAGHEGVMVKSLDASYAAGRRGAEWLKIKPIHSLDLVVLAAEWGSGRRRGWLSNLHLGARDPATAGFAMLGKTFKGMTDEMLAWQTEQLLAREVRREGRTVYVRPELVVEVVFDGVQRSPHYPSGVALRFARIKGYRPDKRATEADVLGTVHDLLP